MEGFTIRQSNITFLLSVTIFFIVSTFCQRSNTPVYWAKNGTTIKNITWEIPRADSASVLRQVEGCWLLPQPPDNVGDKVTSSRHIQPVEEAYQDLLGQVNQEVVHDRGAITREFYRFTKMGILLLGHEGRDSTNQLTVYEPPMKLIPSSIEMMDTTFVSETIPRTWDAAKDTFHFGSKMRLKLTKINRGKVLIDSVAVPAVKCKMSLSQDGTVGYGGTDLIVPDAVIMESHILLVQGLGPVLEWGIRSRKIEENEISPGESDSDEKSPKLSQKRELYIEVTLHKKVKQTL